MKHFENISDAEMFLIIKKIQTQNYGLVQLYKEAEKYIAEHNSKDKHEIFSLFLTLYCIDLEAKNKPPTFSNPYEQ